MDWKCLLKKSMWLSVGGGALLYTDGVLQYERMKLATEYNKTVYTP